MTEAIETQIDRFIVKTEARMLAVVRESIKSVVEESQTPKAKGGRMPVKTGFLRASGQAALDRIPTGPSKGDPAGNYNWGGGPLNVVLARMQLDDTFVWGWTAVYARKQEVFNGFLGASLQNWQSHVNKAVAKFRNRDMRT